MGSDDEEAPKKRKAVSKKNTKKTVAADSVTSQPTRDDKSQMSVRGPPESNRGAGEGDMETQINGIVERIIAERAD